MGLAKYEQRGGGGKGQAPKLDMETFRCEDLW